MLSPLLVHNLRSKTCLFPYTWFPLPHCSPWSRFSSLISPCPSLAFWCISFQYFYAWEKHSWKHTVGTFFISYFTTYFTSYEHFTANIINPDFWRPLDSPSYGCTKLPLATMFGSRRDTALFPPAQDSLFKSPWYWYKQGSVSLLWFIL